MAEIPAVHEPGGQAYIYNPPDDERLMAEATPIVMGPAPAVRALRAACDRPSNPASVR